MIPRLAVTPPPPTSPAPRPARSLRRPAIVAALCAVLAVTGLTGAAPPEQAAVSAAAPPYQDPSLPVPQRVGDLLGRMTLDDKLGQLTQIEKDALVPR